MKSVTGNGHLMIQSHDRPGHLVCGTCGVYDDDSETPCKTPAAHTDEQRVHAATHSGKQ